MYLEECIEQVERQNETTVRAVADLTIDVRVIRHEQTVRFKQVNTRLDKVESDIAELKQDVGTIKQTLQLVLAYLHEKLP